MPNGLPTRTYTLNQAAERCGYARVNTVREKHLTTDTGRQALGHAYDERGRVVLDADAVDRLAERLQAERKRRGNWRIENLGHWARKGRAEDAS